MLLLYIYTTIIYQESFCAGGIRGVIEWPKSGEGILSLRAMMNMYLNPCMNLNPCNKNQVAARGKWSCLNSHVCTISLHSPLLLNFPC